MSYDVRDLKPGMVILTTPRANAPLMTQILDQTIRWSNGPFVHAALVADNCLIEQLSTVTRAPLDKYCSNGWVFQIAGLHAIRAQAMIQWACDRVGQYYGYRAILEDGAMLDLHDWHLLKSRPSLVTCSGFVERAARHGAGIPLSEMPLPTPTELSYSAILIGQRPWKQIKESHAFPPILMSHIKASLTRWRQSK